MSLPPPPGERGFALLIVLWSVVLLTLLGIGLTSGGRADVQLAANLRNEAVAEAAADGAIQIAGFHLLDPESPWPADGAERQVEVPGAQVGIRISNEGGKVNPNLAQPELLQALLAELGVDAQIASRLSQAIVEWRFPRDQSRFGSGQPTAYRNAGLDYGPPGAPFQTLGELGEVLGMTPEILARLTPHLSLFTDAAPDPLGGDPLVTRALRRIGASAGRGEAPLPVRVATITATAITPSGSRFVRQAAIRLGRGDKDPPLRILTWERADGV